MTAADTKVKPSKGLSQERVIKQKDRARTLVAASLDGTSKVQGQVGSERAALQLEKPNPPELRHATIEDKIFNPDDVRFMIQLRSSMHGY
jgi:hypothetical protein